MSPKNGASCRGLGIERFPDSDNVGLNPESLATIALPNHDSDSSERRDPELDLAWRNPEGDVSGITDSQYLVYKNPHDIIFDSTNERESSKGRDFSKRGEKTSLRCCCIVMTCRSLMRDFCVAFLRPSRPSLSLSP